jgi:hypothetical protein
MGLGSGIRDPGDKKAPDPGSQIQNTGFSYTKNIPGISFNTIWNTEMPHLDKHWIAGVLVGLELFAVSVEEDGLGP